MTDYIRNTSVDRIIEPLDLPIMPHGLDHGVFRYRERLTQSQELAVHNPLIEDPIRVTVLKSAQWRLETRSIVHSIRLHFSVACTGIEGNCVGHGLILLEHGTHVTQRFGIACHDSLSGLVGKAVRSRNRTAFPCQSFTRPPFNIHMIPAYKMKTLVCLLVYRTLVTLVERKDLTGDKIRAVLRCNIRIYIVARLIFDRYLASLRGAVRPDDLCVADPHLHLIALR